MPNALGAAIKSLRKRQGLTLKDMADKTGLSFGFISKIERGQSGPSLINLQKLCGALNITPDDLASYSGSALSAQPEAAESAGDSPLIKWDNRALIYEVPDIVKLEAVFVENPRCKLEAMTLMGDKAEYVSSVHQYDEIGVISQGRLSVTMDGQREYVMEKGDVLLIPAGREHTLRKLSKENCVSFWFKLLNDQKL